jgi:uncharacterized protein
MKYEVISGDCHIDLGWLPPDLFTSNASRVLRDRMPYVVDGPDGGRWVSKSGVDFGSANGIGAGGRRYVRGTARRWDEIASTGLYDDAAKGIRRVTDPHLRLKDQDLDGVQAEVLYGILGACARLNDDAASVEMLRIYNEWLTDFCRAHPERYAGLAGIPSCDMDAAVAEVKRVADEGIIRGLDIANFGSTMRPLWDPIWDPLWHVAAEVGLPIHFHTIGGGPPTAEGDPRFSEKVALASRATRLTSFQLYMSELVAALIFAGVFERWPTLRVVIAESGIGWIPYVLDRMDLEWDANFRSRLDLTMKPSDYWHRQCFATYQSDRVGIELLDEIGSDNIIWGSDYPHPDGVWPHSLAAIESELAGILEGARRKIVCENAANLYGFHGDP